MFRALIKNILSLKLFRKKMHKGVNTVKFKKE